MLLPVLTWGGSPNTCRWVAFPYAEPITDVLSTNTARENAVETVTGNITGHDLPLAYDEIVSENIVIYDGTPRLADYGRPDTHCDW